MYRQEYSGAREVCPNLIAHRDKSVLLSHGCFQLQLRCCELLLR